MDGQPNRLDPVSFDIHETVWHERVFHFANIINKGEDGRSCFHISRSPYLDVFLIDAVSIGPDQIAEHGGGNSFHSGFFRNHYHFRALVFIGGCFEGNRVGRTTGEIEKRWSHFVHGALGANHKGMISGALGKQRFAFKQGRCCFQLCKRTLPTRERFLRSGNFIRKPPLAHFARMLEVGGDLLLAVLARKLDSLNAKTSLVNHIAAFSRLIGKDGDFPDL